MSTSSYKDFSNEEVILPRDTNQALGIAHFSLDFLNDKIGDHINLEVYEKVKMFHTDSIMCGVSALALKTNAPTILREEALTYTRPDGAFVLGSKTRCAAEKVICANSSAVREWDSNGTVFGYRSDMKSNQAGEYGHNDFYPVVIAASQMQKGKDIDGKKALKAMILLDEIRGRLAEVFSLKTYKIDHVVHGAIASAAVYGALLKATPEQIESAIGLTVAHYIPWRAIRAGKQLSDSKGASAALSTEVAILSMQRAMMGFQGPKDIFRNPEAVFRWNEKTDGSSPFDLILRHSGEGFAVQGMHFKLGLYEHQSAGALEGMLKLLIENSALYKTPEKIKKIIIKAYEPAFGIIGDPAKRDPRTRQSADHSMVYIVSTLIRKAIELQSIPNDLNDAWCQLMLSPYDYSKKALFDSNTRELMERVHFEHGGKEYDEKYPEGIPTSIHIEMDNGQKLESGLVMFPSGHARNKNAKLEMILEHKYRMLGNISMNPKDSDIFINKLNNIYKATNSDLQEIYYFDSLLSHQPID